MQLKILAVGVVALFAGIMEAQSPSTNSSSGATVSGAVFDSIARMPLAGAIVQIVAADAPSRFERSVTADSLGRFALNNVPDGAYAVGFFHPLLDSLGVEAPLKKLTVNGGRSIRVDLAIPSPMRLKAAICKQSPSDSSAMITGIVRDSKTEAPASEVSVWGEWLELSIGTRGVSQSVQRVRAVTSDNGWFALCNLPASGTIALVAIRGVDSTGVLELPVPAEKFMRRDLYVGVARRDGRLRGTVAAAAGGKPVANAQVSVVDGPQTRTNDRGEWTLTDAPTGSRMLEVRALGYYPDRRRVDVVAASPPIDVRLSTLRAVLDTVKIVASRLRNDEGFEQRRRAGMGRFITAEDFKRFPVIETSDFFKRLPGFRHDGSREQIQMRGAFGWCAPAIFIDGHELSFMAAEDIDDWVPPHKVAGIEVYSEGTAPPQFHPGLRGCGSIVVWTK
jgi:hypothetical protein